MQPLCFVHTLVAEPTMLLNINLSPAKTKQGCVCREPQIGDYTVAQQSHMLTPTHRSDPNTVICFPAYLNFNKWSNSFKQRLTDSDLFVQTAPKQLKGEITTFPNGTH